MGNFLQQAFPTQQVILLCIYLPHTNIHTVPLRYILSSHKRVGPNGFASSLYTIADVFQVHLKGYSRALNVKKLATAFRAKKVESFLMWISLPKTQKPVILEVQPMCRYSPCRQRTCNDSCYSATTFLKKNFFFLYTPLWLKVGSILPPPLKLLWLHGEYLYMSCILLSNIRANFVLVSPLALMSFWQRNPHLKRLHLFWPLRHCNRFFEV